MSSSPLREANIKYVIPIAFALVLSVSVYSHEYFALERSIHLSLHFRYIRASTVSNRISINDLFS